MKILVIEDNDMAQKIEVLLLQDLGCDVDAASTGNSALKLLNDKNYDLIFMDIGLPDIDGLVLAESIRKSYNRNSKCPIVAVTNYEDESYKNQAICVGMNEFAIKPLTRASCVTFLQKFYNRKKAH